MFKLKYGTPEYEVVRSEILINHGVVHTKNFDAKLAIRARVEFLKNFLRKSNRKSFILGISGGVDSAVAGKLAQLACVELRSEGYEAFFVAMRLPAGVQLDEHDAQESLRFISPDKMITVNIGAAATDLSNQGVTEFNKLGGALTESQIDYNKGNIKARLRMVAQYQASAMFEGIVLGTDHPCEMVMAFYTRFGDEACDVTVLNGLNKRQIRLVAKELGASQNIYDKPPTADLEELKPLKLDDDGFGFPYNYLEDFLEGDEIPSEIEEKIVNHYNVTRYKRGTIPGFPS